MIDHELRWKYLVRGETLTVVGKTSRHFAVLYVTIAPEEHLVALYLDERSALGRCRYSQVHAFQDYRQAKTTKVLGNVSQ